MRRERRIGDESEELERRMSIDEEINSEECENNHSQSEESIGK